MAGWIEGSANRATFANDESRPGSQSPQDWHVISPFYFTALPLLPFTIPLTQSRPHQTNYLNCLGESNGRTFRPQCIVSRPILRYSGPPSSEPLDPYGDSEEEESEEELDSVSVVADRAGCRDRLSGD